MRGFLSRIQQWGERRLPALTRYRRPEALPIELHRRRIYIVPTGFGVGFSILLLVMLLGALNYANNAALLLTCLLGATTSASMLVAFRSLNGLRLSHIHAGNAIAGEMLTLTLEFDSSRPRNAIRVDLGACREAFAIDASGKACVQLPLSTARRGWQALPRLRLWSTWPLGLFRAWSWLYPQQQVLVWPQPEFGGPPPRLPVDDGQQRPRLHQGEDLAALRHYRPGDPRRHIAWKASARHDGLLTKDFEQPETRSEWQLDWRHLSGLNHEARIARLARWLGEAQAQGRTYSLWLPDHQVEAGNGPRHYARCMSALAMLP